MKTLIFIFASIILVSCKRDAPAQEPILTLPTVVTGSISSTTSTSVSATSSVTSDGGAAVTARGMCWSTSPNPDTTGNHTLKGTGTGIFINAVTGLTPHTTYY